MACTDSECKRTETYQHIYFFPFKMSNVYKNFTKRRTPSVLCLSGVCIIFCLCAVQRGTRLFRCSSCTFEFDRPRYCKVERNEAHTILKAYVGTEITAGLSPASTLKGCKSLKTRPFPPLQKELPDSKTTAGRRSPPLFFLLGVEAGGVGRT